jgi:hypothetical protein
MNVSEIAKSLMGRFRETNPKVDHAIDQKCIQLQFISDLNPKEQDLVNPVINHLRDNGTGLHRSIIMNLTIMCGFRISAIAVRIMILSFLQCLFVPCRLFSHLVSLR